MAGRGGGVRRATPAPPRTQVAGPADANTQYPVAPSGLLQLAGQLDDLLVRRKLLEPLEQHVELLLAVSGLAVQEAPEPLHRNQLRLRVEQLLAPRPRCRNIDGRVEA